jgi:FkbM family methyltransferase
VINNIVREEYGQFPLKEQSPSMIDAGAYIGDTSAYFLSKYPDLEVVALEPDGDNHEMAQKNLAAYGSRVLLGNKALSSSPGTLLISGTHDGAFISSTGKAVEATTVPDLMTLMGWQRLGILKMDIEGAEARVLDRTADRWLNRVDRLIIEPHGPLVETEVKQTLHRNGFAVKSYRSLWYCARES